MSLYSIEAVLILDTDGNRLLAKYYVPLAFPLVASKSIANERMYESKLVCKTKGLNGDILILDNHLIVYKQSSDVLIYLMAPVDENEAMIYQVLTTLYDTVDTMLKHKFDRSSIIEHYDHVALAVDEVVDNGIILQTESRIITQRLTLESNESKGVNIHIDIDQGIRSMLDFAKGKLSDAVRHQIG